MKFLSSLAVLPLAGLLILTLIACRNNNAADSVKELNRKSDNKNYTYKVPAADSTGENKNAPQNPTANNDHEDWDKKIIKTATLSVEVKNYKAFNDMLRPAIKNLGGYIAQEEQVQDDYKIENNIIVKVPVDQFDNAVQQLTPSTEKIDEKKISSTDVTGEMVDTKSRIEAKKKVRDRYIDLLRQAKNMEEILQVQTEINDIQEQIESATGRVEYLGHSSAYSTINLRFYQVLNATAIVKQQPSFAQRVSDSFTSGLHWLGELLVLFITLWPAWLGGIVLWLIIRRYKPVPAKNNK